MSKKLKLSPWHDGSVKPVHSGLYQRKTFQYLSDIDWCWFDGGEWYVYGIDGKDAYKEFKNGNISGRIGPWRGVLK